MKPLTYRHFFMSGGMFKNCKVEIGHNDELNWHIRKVELEDPNFVDVLWLNMRSKSRAIEVCNKNNWEIIS